jgi:O-antigen ligase
LFLILSFTIPLVKGVPGIVHVALIILFVVQMSYRKEYKIEARKYYIAILLFLSVSAMSLIYSSDIVDGLHIFKGQCLLLIGVILIERVSTADSARRYLYAYAVGGTVLACIGAYQGLFLKEFRPPNINNFHPVWAGNLMMISTVVLLALIISERSFLLKVLNALMLTVNGVALYFNGTRGVWLALIAVLFLAPFFQRSIGIKRRLIYILSLTVIAMIACNVNYFHSRISEAKGDINTYNSSTANTSLGGRFEMWKVSATMFKKHPIFGIGTGSWKSELKTMIGQHKAPEFISIYGQTHNIYLDALSTRGLLGFVALLLLLACPVYYAWKRCEPENTLFRNVVIFLAIAFFVSGLSETIVLLRLVFMSYVFITGLGLAVLTGSGTGMSHSFINDSKVIGEEAI